MKIRKWTLSWLLVLALSALCFAAASDYKITNDGKGYFHSIIPKASPWVDVRAYGAKIDGSTDDTTSVQNAINTGSQKIVFPEGTCKFSTLAFNADGQELVGEGKQSILSSTTAGTAISASAKSRCGISNLKLVTSSAVTGISFAAASNRCSVSNVWVEGFSGSGIVFSNSLYGYIGNACEIVSNGTGIQLTNSANSTKIIGNELRQNLIGIQIDDTGGSANGAQVTANGIESSTAGSTYAIKIVGGDSNMIVGNRIENSVGTAHILVDYGVGIAQFNQVIGNSVEGTIPFIVLGNGTGTGQVVGTYIAGGRAAGDITINSDATSTSIEAAPGAFGGTFTDNGYGTRVNIDPNTAGKWYTRNISSNSNNGFQMTIGGSSTLMNFGTNYLQMDYTDLAQAFTFKTVDAGGTQLAVMMFGAYRIWINQTTAKMYINGIDPTSPTDGTIIGP